ncbi:MAG: hypothetical protein Kow0074_24360 [Candidatus Zixiibacteriota bacterium]
MNSTVGRVLLVGAAIFLSAGGCGRESATGPEPSVEIVSPHRSTDGRLVWDPNEEPVLYLAARAATDVEGLRWRQLGWQVDDSHWRGAVLRVSVETPGCGYGGQEFRISALWPDGREAATVTVWMEKYICDGSPWLEE